ncbi:MAG: hypothetical protein FJ241_13450 [Nitrospira sp.]|nr:hypothetical protein [Nitrospira sp.]
MIGKPYSGKLNVRFDEGELEIGLLSLRQFSTLPFSSRSRSLKPKGAPVTLPSLSVPAGRHRILWDGIPNMLI